MRTFSSNCFSIENSVSDSMPFLDVLVNQECDSFQTKVYVKPTNTGYCLNGKKLLPPEVQSLYHQSLHPKSIHPLKYFEARNEETEESTEVLINNGFRKGDVTRCIKKVMDRWFSPINTNEESKTDITIYHWAFSSTSYEKEKE